jgi:hypothetical protein
MTYRGHVNNGVVVFDDAVTLPEGLSVRVEPADSIPDEDDEKNIPDEDDEKNIPTLLERLAPFVGKLEGLPPDASVNVDHYLYGLPKRE